MACGTMVLTFDQEGPIFIYFYVLIYFEMTSTVSEFTYASFQALSDEQEVRRNEIL